MKTLVTLLLFNLILISCGSDSSDHDAGIQEEVSSIESDEPMKEGEYVAYLRTLNSSVNGFIPFGRAELSLQKDEFKIVTYLDDDQSVMHMQRIHSGSRCPTLADDTNNDGYIDLLEAELALGEVIIPLDHELQSRKAGEDKYPIGPGFTYSRSASWSALVDDLRQDYRPGYYVLVGDHLSLENKVLLIHGTSPTGLVPSSLQTSDQWPSHLSVPIACGVIKAL